jgi:mannose-6-phosphate isomerase-like protein (cupin superfamily)
MPTILWTISPGVDSKLKYIKPQEKQWLKLTGYSKKILFTEHKLKSKGNLVQIVNSEPHTEIKPHYHERMKEVYHVIKRNAIVFCRDTRVQVQPQDTILYEPKKVHGVINDTD